MTKRRFYTELEFILGLEPNTIQGTEVLESLAGWDSVAKVSFIGMGYAELDADISPEVLVACKTVADLVSLFDGKIV